MRESPVLYLVDAFIISSWTDCSWVLPTNRQILGIHNAPTYRDVMHAIIAEANAKGIPTYPVSHWVLV